MNQFTALFSLGIFATSLIAVEPSAALMQRIIDAADKNKGGRLLLEEYRTRLPSYRRQPGRHIPLRLK